MTIYQQVDTGSADDDGTGDTLRAAFAKVNANTALQDVAITMDESSAQADPGAAKGRLWVKDTAPTTLIFTDDTGVETVLGSGGGGASELSDLTDVNTSTPTNRFALIADGVDFESRAIVQADISDVTSTAAELNLLDLAGMTADWILSADTATTASWKAPRTREKSLNQPGELITIISTLRWYPTTDITLINITANVGVAATAANIVLDVKKNDVSILASNITILATEFTAAPVVPTDTTLLTTDYLTVDILQIGLSLPGEDLVVNFKYQ